MSTAGMGMWRGGEGCRYPVIGGRVTAPLQYSDTGACQILAHVARHSSKASQPPPCRGLPLMGPSQGRLYAAVDLHRRGSEGLQVKQTTKLRLIGGAVLLFNLWLIGQYKLEGIPVLLLTFGFAIGYEYLVVRPAKRKADGDPR